MKKQHKKILRGAAIGAITAGIANLITYKTFGWLNVGISALLGIIIYFILHTEVLGDGF